MIRIIARLSIVLMVFAAAAYPASLTLSFVGAVPHGLPEGNLGTNFLDFTFGSEFIRVEAFGSPIAPIPPVLFRTSEGGLGILSSPLGEADEIDRFFGEFLVFSVFSTNWRLTSFELRLLYAMDDPILHMFPEIAQIDIFSAGIPVSRVIPGVEPRSLGGPGIFSFTFPHPVPFEFIGFHVPDTIYSDFAVARLNFEIVPEPATIGFAVSGAAAFLLIKRLRLQ